MDKTNSDKKDNAKILKLEKIILFTYNLTSKIVGAEV